MLSIIKTAIITIIISFISGVLLDYYKNYSPRILCDITKCRNMKLNNKRVKVYTLTIKNNSKKTIHDLNLNLKAHCDNLKIDDAKITSGLKYDLVRENNIYDISIPFLSKNDQFSVKLYLENLQKKKSIPIVTLRSPENFKRINSSDGIQSSIKDYKNNALDNYMQEVNSKGKNIFKNKKAIIAIVSVLVLALCGVFVGEYFIKDNNNSSNAVINNENEEDNSNNKVNNNQKLNATSKEANNKQDTSSNKKNNNNNSSTSNSKTKTKGSSVDNATLNNSNSNKTEENGKDIEKNTNNTNEEKNSEKNIKSNNVDNTKSSNSSNEQGLVNNSGTSKENTNKSSESSTKTP